MSFIKGSWIGLLKAFSTQLNYLSMIITGKDPWLQLRYSRRDVILTSLIHLRCCRKFSTGAYNKEPKCLVIATLHFPRLAKFLCRTKASHSSLSLKSLI